MGIHKDHLKSHKDTGYAGWYVKASIPVKFSTAHGGSRPEVGTCSTKRIGGYGGVSWPSLIYGTSDQYIIPSTIFLRPKLNCFSLTVCKLHQYLPHNSEMTGLLP